MRVAVVSAWEAPFDAKDNLKARGYRWNRTERVWWREVGMDQVDAEKQWLIESVYGGDGTPGVRPVSPFQRFVSRRA